MSALRVPSTKEMRNHLFMNGHLGCKMSIATYSGCIRAIAIEESDSPEQVSLYSKVGISVCCSIVNKKDVDVECGYSFIY